MVCVTAFHAWRPQCPIPLRSKSSSTALKTYLIPGPNTVHPTLLPRPSPRTGNATDTVQIAGFTRRKLARMNFGPSLNLGERGEVGAVQKQGVGAGRERILLNDSRERREPQANGVTGVGRINHKPSSLLFQANRKSVRFQFPCLCRIKWRFFLF